MAKLDGGIAPLDPPLILANNYVLVSTA